MARGRLRPAAAVRSHVDLAVERGVACVVGSSGLTEADYDYILDINLKGPFLLSQAVGKPVRVQFMRWDEHGWDNYSPAVLADMRGAVDANGKIVALDYTTLAIPEMAMESVATSQHVGLPVTQGFQQRFTQANITVPFSFALPDVDDHTLLIDIAHF